MFDVSGAEYSAFRDYCQKVGISERSRHHAFSIVLDGMTLDFYFGRILVSSFPDNLRLRPLHTMIWQIKIHFENTQQQMNHAAMRRAISLRK